jgi:hypothetical protein
MEKSMTATLKYFAYGSNLHPLRLQQRVPSCRVIDIVNLQGYKLEFHKRSEDGSSKCNAFFTGEKHDVIFGVVYEITAAEKVRLDRAEGLGAGYNEAVLELTLHGEKHKVFTYVADPNYIDESLKPYQWYKEFVACGARHHCMPEPYIERINRIDTQEDNDEYRRSLNIELLDRMLTQ